MSGLLLLAALVALSLLGLWLLKLRGAMLQLAAAAMLLGAAGYAVQGRPGLPGSPGRAASSVEAIPLDKARRAFFGEFSPSEHWLIISASYARRGKTQDAVGVLHNAVGKYPGDAQLWIGLGNALVDHARVLTPAAELAFQRAAQLAPDHPAPSFFLGLAHARSGDRRTAIALWTRLLADAPADAGWRPLVEDGIAALAGAAPPPTRPAQR